MTHPPTRTALEIRPIELSEANAFVGRLHRHHKPVQGHRWSLSARLDDTLVGVVICGRPVARMTDQRMVLEITRLCTDGTRNVCSFLYGRAAAVAKLMGFSRIQTFILASESGVSLKAAGYTKDDIDSAGGDWTRASRPNRRQDQPQEPKQRWSKTFR